MLRRYMVQVRAWRVLAAPVSHQLLRTLLREDEEAAGGGVGSGAKTMTWKKWIDSGTWEVDIAGVKYPAEVSLRPMYDPKNAAIKA